MNIDAYALISALLGVVFGVYFVLKNLRYMKHAIYALQLIVDKDYSLSLYRKLQTENYYNATKYTFDYLPYNQHFESLEQASQNYYESVVSEYVVIGRDLLLQFVRLFILPSILFIVIGQITAFIGASVVAIVAMLWYKTYMKYGASFKTHAQYTILIRHAYSLATVIPNTDTRSYSSNGSIAQPEQLTGVSFNSRSVPHGGDDSNNDTNDSSYVCSAAASTENSNKTNVAISWTRLWWGNDIALCALLSVLFVLMNHGSFVDLVLGILQLILFVQLFFLPVWAVISIALKLLSKYN